MRFLILFYLLANLSSTHVVVAQKMDYQKIYSQAKTELRNKNFDKAGDLFKKASADNPENLQRVNAMYFHAYCALKGKQYWSANHYLNKIISKYPDWNKISEVYYLQAEMAFEKKEYTAAIQSAQQIKSKFLYKDLDNMKWNFLFYPSLQDTVATLQKKYPNDTSLATILYHLLKDDDGFKARKQAKSLAKQFSIKTESAEDEKTEAKKEPEPLSIAPIKDTFKIAVVLPFNLDENIKDGMIKSNYYVFDLYTGIRLAADSMKRAGAKIKLYAYDYGKDSLGFYNLATKPEMTQYDVLIGPLHNSLASKTAQLAEATKTLNINPLSTSLKFTEESSRLFLFKPSLETQTMEAATFAWTNFKPKKALVITSKNPKDSMLASLFHTSFEQAGGKVLNRLTLTASTLPKLSTLFNSKTLDSTGVIFVSTKDQYLGVNVVRKLTELNRTTPILAFSEWLDFQSLNYDQMQKQNIHFISSDYMRFVNDSSDAISNYLQSSTNSLPSNYTFTGFELMCELALLAQKDSLFFNQPNLALKVFRPTGAYHGLDYTKGKDNRIISIYKFSELGFVKLK